MELKNLDEEGFLALTAMLLVAVSALILTGFGYCYVEFGVSNPACFRSTPFLFGYMGLMFITVFYYSSPYFKVYRSCSKSRGSRKGCFRKAVMRMRKDLNHGLNEVFGSEDSEDRSVLNLY